VAQGEEGTLIGYILRRVLFLLPTVLGVTIITFILSHTIPADPARLALGIDAPLSQITRYHKEHGFDKPLYVQYLIYMGQLLRGNLGVSMTSRRPVMEDLKDYFPATLELVLTSAIFSFPLGIVLGVIAAQNKNSVIDYGTRLLSMVGVSFPVFWVGILFLLIFYLRLHLYPGMGRISPGVILEHPFQRVTGLFLIDTVLAKNVPAFLSSLSHIWLPALCLAFSPIARLARITRASVLDVLNEEYIKVARSKGLIEWKVIYKHTLRNSLTPILTVVGLSIGYALAGSVLVEAIFAWPGIGTYAFMAASNLDYPAIMGVTLLSTILFMIVNLTMDICYGVIDPRIVLG